MNQSSTNSKSNDVSKKHYEELQGPPEEKIVESIPAAKLRSDAMARAKKRPLLQKLMNRFRGESATFRELIINSEPLERRVSLLEDGILEKFEIERRGEDRIVGSIYKGRIQNLDNGLKAAFVDINLPKNAFLHYWDILPGASDSSIEVVHINRPGGQNKAKKPKQIGIKDIPSLYPIGKEIVVQVTKGPIGTKGPRTTTNLSLPGRFLVLMPYTDQCGISRKIEDPKERQRLKKLLRELTIPEGMGVIIRTAAEGKKQRYFIRDLHFLLKKWDTIREKIEDKNFIGCLYEEPDLLERTVRDFLTEEIDRVLIDDQEDYQRMLDLVSTISSRSRSKIQLYKDTIPIFERFNIERQIEQTFQRQVPLPSGGQIVIEETEALIAIDVNTGGHRSRGADGKDTITQVNLEAAHEISRQIRLRNIGGLIIIDFIDMKSRRDRNLVQNRMRDLMADDKAKTHILPISQLGIMQMTRQRQQESTAASMYTGCPYCRARGMVKSPRSMSVEIQRRLTSVLRRHRTGKDLDKQFSLRILVNPAILDRLRSEDEQLLAQMQSLHGVTLTFRADPSFHMENFKIVEAESGEEFH